MDGVGRLVAFVLAFLSLTVNARSVWITEIASYAIVDSTRHACELQANEWQRTTDFGLKVPYGKVLWFKLDDEAREFDVVLSNSVNLDEMTSYIGCSQSTSCGEFYRSSNRQSYSLKLPGDTCEPLYVRVRMEEGFICPVRLVQTEDLRQHEIWHSFFSAFYTGGMTVMLMYNIMLFITIQRKLFLYYSIYVLFVSLTQLSIFSNLWISLGIESIAFLRGDLHIFSSLLGMSIVPFVIELFDLKKCCPKLKVILYVFFWSYLIPVFLLGYQRYYLSFQFLNLLNGLGSIYLIVVAVLLLRKQPLAKYFLLSWSTFLVGVLVFQLENLKVISLDGFSTWGMACCSLIECIFFSIIIGAIYKQLDRQKLENEYQLMSSKRALSVLREDYFTSEYKFQSMAFKPHMLFNILTSIQYFLVRENVEEALLYIQRYAMLIRRTLEQVNKSWIRIDEEIDLLKSYVDLKRIEYKDLIVQLVLPEEQLLSKYLIPSMLIQPLVENCFKHAFENKTDTCIISLEFDLDIVNSIVIVKVADNGRGMGATQKTGHVSFGMSNLRKRLLLINKRYKIESARLEVEETTASGTRIRLSIPYRENGN